MMLLNHQILNAANPHHSQDLHCENFHEWWKHVAWSKDLMGKMGVRGNKDTWNKITRQLLINTKNLHRFLQEQCQCSCLNIARVIKWYRVHGREWDTRLGEKKKEDDLWRFHLLLPVHTHFHLSATTASISTFQPQTQGTSHPYM
jgi:hypothetical protein